jgi:beta-lactamase superfamily II metal-dependent hydrolase
MTRAMTVEVLPALHGDAILITCFDNADVPCWTALFDGGPPAYSGPLLDRLRTIDVLDLVVVTHIDADHIGGLLAVAAAEPSAIPLIRQWWFNDAQHLPTNDDVAEKRAVRSFAQGIDLSELLQQGVQQQRWQWNTDFQGGPVVTAGPGSYITIPQESGPQLTVLSPTPKRLEALTKRWHQEYAAMFISNRREVRSSTAPLSPDDITSIAALEELANRKSPTDTSVPNGSSIAVLVEHRGCRVLLTGDAFAPVVGGALFTLAHHRGEEPFALDIHKLSHHASRGNVVVELLERFPSTHYVVSTNGAIHHHPDIEAIARILSRASAGTGLWCNAATVITEAWKRCADRLEIPVVVHLPTPNAPSIVLTLEANAP